MRALVAGLVVIPLSCSVPPRGEVVLFVDTDARVPQLVSRLRVEVMRASDGTVIDARDVARPDPADWPVSFGVTSDAIGARALVRLRAYPEGRLDGEEPQRAVTIDRLVLVEVKPNVVSSVAVTLRGECFDAPADLAARASCKDTSGAIEPIEVLAPRPPVAVPKTFGDAPCTAAPRAEASSFEEEICIPGGAFLFGNLDQFGSEEANGIPERVAVIPPLRVDRYEVTVGRWRAALAQGFIPPSAPFANDAPLQGTSTLACTFSAAPMQREAYPLNCVTLPSARAFCRWAGGDLPTEAEWEYAAMIAGRPFKTPYPWGSTDPDCDRVVFGRSSALALCPDRGPAPEDATPGDETLLGVRNLGGDLAEMTLDAWRSLGAPCWRRAALHDPRCDDTSTSLASLRGGAWDQSIATVASGNRYQSWNPFPASISPGIGFRCVRPGSPQGAP